MTKTMTTLFLVLTTLAAAGCAAPVAPAVPTQAPEAATETPVAKRQLMAMFSGKQIDDTAAGGPAPVRPWGLHFSGDEHFEDYTVREGNEELAHLTGRITNRAGIERFDNVWRAGVAYSGDGSLQYTGDRRFVYYVPAGRLLVINRQNGYFSLDGVPYGSNIQLANWNNQSSQILPNALDIVAGPGAMVVFQLGDNTTISGFTCDPAMRGMAGLGAAAGVAPNSGK